MATPIPVFPAAVATDAQLKVANNLITTTLQLAINSANTILFVSSTAGFSANMLVSIDKEIIAITDVVPGPNPALLVAPGGRGFDGTTAAAHAAGAKISVLIDAWHHNVLASEVKAIEAFIGPNGQNLGVNVYGGITPHNYNFAAQQPGGTLNVGSNVITLSPVPIGVNGSDTNHYLYISGGTGTAEAVLITGGTAVSGAPSGTLIFTCANAHSGAWTIQSATAGLQETHNSLPPNGGTIWIPANYYVLYATVTVTKNINIIGDGMRSTYFQLSAPNQIGFDLRSTAHGFPNCKFENFGITTLSGGQQTAGGCGFRLGTPTVESNANIFVNISFLFLWDGVLMVSSSVDQFNGCEFSACGHAGIVAADAVNVDNNGPYIVNCNFTWYEPSPGAFTRGLAGIVINSTGGIEISNCQFAAYQWGVYLNSSGSSGLMMSNFDLENTSLGGIYVSGTYGRVVISNGSISQFGVYPGWIGIEINNTAGGGGTASSFNSLNIYQNGSVSDARGVVMINAGGGYSFNNMMFYGMSICFDLDAASANMVILACDFQQSFGAGTLIKAATGSFPLVIGCTGVPVADLLDSTKGTWNAGSQQWAVGGRSTSGPGTALIAGGNGTMAVRTVSGWIALV